MAILYKRVNHVIYCWVLKREPNEYPSDRMKLLSNQISVFEISSGPSKVLLLGVGRVANFFNKCSDWSIPAFTSNNST